MCQVSESIVVVTDYGLMDTERILVKGHSCFRKTGLNPNYIYN